MDNSVLVMHEDVFAHFFEPYLPEGATGGAFGGDGLLPGMDWHLVSSLPTSQVWTVVESEGEWWISPGLHLVNRHCYLATRRPHHFHELLFRSYRQRPFLTPRGLRRQLTRLRRVFDGAARWGAE